MTIAVTGHRPDKLNGEYDMRGPTSRMIYNELDKIVGQISPSQMISGMALGVDMIFANVAINRKIPFIAAIPFEGQESKWPESSQRTYRKMLSYATEIKYVCSPGYAGWKMQKRNEWMVNNCDVLIAVWNGTKGGTFNCVNYAVDKGKDIRRIDPSLFHV